jgi:hypothetical protein
MIMDIVTVFETLDFFYEMSRPTAWEVFIALNDVERDDVLLDFGAV